MTYDPNRLEERNGFFLSLLELGYASFTLQIVQT